MNRTEPDSIQRIAEFAAGVAQADIPLPPTVAELCREMMLNAAGAALAGAAHPAGVALARVVREMGGNGRSTIIGMGMRTSPVYASLVNGTLVRLLDYDDNTVEAGAHVTAAVFPPVMALGEMHGYSGRDVLSAFAAGCEVAARFSTVDATRGSAGAMGAAVASSMLLGLDAAGLASAVGLAVHAGNGGREYGSAGAAAMSQGRAAMQGVIAALSAEAGIDGTCSSPTFGTADFADLGVRWRLEDPGVTIRLYPCHPASHSVIDAILGLAQLHRFEPSDVSSVHIGVTAGTTEQLPHVLPADGWQARRSIGFIAAATLCHGAPLINFFSEPAVRDEGVRAMMECISIEATLPASPLALNPAELAITLNDGRALRHRIDHPRGSPAMPLDAEELDAKFLYCTRYILPADHIDEAVSSFRGILEIENVTGMASVLGG